MSNVWGQNLKISVFGESHGTAIGVVMENLPPGTKIDWAAVSAEMVRRAPGKSPLATPRTEKDEWEILSGYFEGHTTGAPLCAIIRNENTRPKDYMKDFMRPGHADLSAFYKFGGFTDYRGGGQFSGRLTAPLVFAGAIAKQLLQTNQIRIGARIKQIHTVIDDSICSVSDTLSASKKTFQVYDDTIGAAMQNAILTAKENGDSVGGIIECVSDGIQPGLLGEPMFHSLESVISAMMFSIPAVKAIEFGDGFDMVRHTGYEMNDQMMMQDGSIQFQSNHNGGILGGISNGNPLVFRIAIKPTPTISREQTTVDIQKGETIQVRFGGRHDPCIVPRAVPVVEAGLALCILDFLHPVIINHRKEVQP